MIGCAAVAIIQNLVFVANNLKVGDGNSENVILNYSLPTSPLFWKWSMPYLYIQGIITEMYDSSIAHISVTIISKQTHHLPFKTGSIWI